VLLSPVKAAVGGKEKPPKSEPPKPGSSGAPA